MKRKWSLLMLGIVLAFLSGSALILGILLKHEPNFYRRGAVPEGAERIDLSNAFWSHAIELGKNFNVKPNLWKSRWKSLYRSSNQRLS